MSFTLLADGFQNTHMIYIWLGVFILGIIIELATEELVSIWFALAAVIAAPFALLSIAWYWQLLIFVVCSSILLIVLRQLVKKKIDVRHIATNTDSLIGREIVLTKDMSVDGAEGCFRDSDVVWTVFLKDEDRTDLKKGEVVICKEIRGNHLIVEKKHKEVK